AARRNAREVRGVQEGRRNLCEELTIAEEVMVERRDVIGGGLAAGLAAVFRGDPAQGAQTTQRSSTADSDSQTAKAVDTLRAMFEHQHESDEIMRIRAQQRTFLKANQKFPDF